MVRVKCMSECGREVVCLVGGKWSQRSYLVPLRHLRLLIELLIGLVYVRRSGRQPEISVGTEHEAHTEREDVKVAFASLHQGGRHRHELAVFELMIRSAFPESGHGTRSIIAVAAREAARLRDVVPFHILMILYEST